VTEAIQRFKKHIINYGTVCAVCGVKSYNFKNINIDTLRSWKVTVDDDKLIQSLYPHFPKQDIDEKVCILQIAFLICTS